MRVLSGLECPLWQTYGPGRLSRVAADRGGTRALRRPPSFGRAKQLYGRERFSRPRPEAVQRELRPLSRCDVNEDVVVFLLGRLALPIKVRRIAFGHLDARPAGEQRVLVSDAAA